MRCLVGVGCLLLLAIHVGCQSTATADEPAASPDEAAQPSTEQEKPVSKPALATFGGGCFWCTEAVFAELRGVSKVVSGYMGGQTQNPTYREVCTGLTGHAEVIQVEYDPEVVPYEVLLEIFWKTHDPTTLNRQGADVGTQYRSVIFYHDERQKQLAEEYKYKLDHSTAFDDPIVTEITPASTFYPAEDYHQDFFAQNPNQPYCKAIIPDKLKKLRRVFGDRLKDAPKK